MSSTPPPSTSSTTPPTTGSDTPPKRDWGYGRPVESPHCPACIEIPCHVCSWTDKRENGCHYESQIKLFYACMDRAAWSLGSKYVLKDRGPRQPTLETPNIQFVKEHTTIPVPTVIHSWEEDGHDYTLMTRIPGETLHDAWPKLSDDEKANIAKQTAEYLLQLRTMQSDKFQYISGRPPNAGCFVAGSDGRIIPHGTIASDDELWEVMKLSLHESVPECARVLLRKSMPSTAPWTFSHCDLTDVNIIVQNGSLTGIIDWEHAGYFPVWWEYARTSIPDSDEDAEWKACLRNYMPDHSEAREFWRDYFHLSVFPEMDRAMKFIEKARSEAC